MAIKLAVLQDHEQVIAEIKELVDEGKPIGYLFTNAHRVLTEKQFLAESDDDRKVQITLSPWKKCRFMTGLLCMIQYTVLYMQYCCNSTVATVLLQQYCCNSTACTVLYIVSYKVIQS